MVPPIKPGWQNHGFPKPCATKKPPGLRSLVIGSSCCTKAARDLDGVLLVTAQEQLSSCAVSSRAYYGVPRSDGRCARRHHLPAQALLYLLRRCFRSVVRKWRRRTVDSPRHIWPLEWVVEQFWMQTFNLKCGFWSCSTFSFVRLKLGSRV